MFFDFYIKKLFHVKQFFVQVVSVSAKLIVLKNNLIRSAVYRVK